MILSLYHSFSVQVSPALNIKKENDMTILITGATGTIGTSLLQQLASHHVACLCYTSDASDESLGVDDGGVCDDAIENTKKQEG